MKVFALDPMLGDAAGNRITIQVANEPLGPGPRGARIAGRSTTTARQPPLLRAGRPRPPGAPDARRARPARVRPALPPADGLRRGDEGARELRRARSAGGCRFKGGTAAPPLARTPSAARTPSTTRAQRAVLFGYFRADARDPGPNLPGQTVFTCLSHDIIAHEVTHALVDRLRAAVPRAPPTTTCSPSTRASPTSSPSSSTSPSARSCAEAIQETRGRPRSSPTSLVQAGPAVRLRHRQRHGAALGARDEPSPTRR